MQTAVEIMEHSQDLINQLLSADNIALTLSVVLNAYFLWSNHNRRKEEIDIQRAEIEKDLKVAEALHSLSNQIDVNAKLEKLALKE